MNNKDKITKVLTNIKQEVKKHPQTTAIHLLVGLTFIAGAYVAAQIAKAGIDILKGNIVNPFTPDQVAGLTILSICLSLLLFFWVGYLVFTAYVLPDIQEKEEKKWEKKQNGKSD